MYLDGQDKVSGHLGILTKEFIMESGQVFKVDAQAAKDLGNDDLEGLEYAITSNRGNITDVEVRASKFVNGKPSRGRPRRFPRSVVARLLGETDDVSTQDSGDSDEADMVEQADELIAAEVSTESAVEELEPYGDDNW